MKIFYFYSIFLIAIFSNHNLFSQTRKSKSSYKVSATYYPYTTAMGKGKGIIFKVDVFCKSIKKFTIDSFFVNSKSLPFILKNNSKGVSVESNYLKSKEDPSVPSNGTEMKIPNEISDEIIVKQKFYPSWIIINQQGKYIKLYIKNYSIINSTL